MNTSRVVRIAFMAFLAVYGVVLLRNPDAGWLLSSLDLAIHETGHLVVAPFGEVIGFLGGTLFQLIVPGAFVAHFLRREDQYGAAVCLWWVGQNCWNISVYIADARAQELPLVGGGEHDWAYLLDAGGWLHNDQAIARAVHATGVLVFLVALVLGVRAVSSGRSSPASEERASVEVHGD
jgi:hypothetical protein